jgi:hypothetical protein
LRDFLSEEKVERPGRKSDEFHHMNLFFYLSVYISPAPDRVCIIDKEELAVIDSFVRSFQNRKNPTENY